MTADHRTEENDAGRPVDSLYVRLRSLERRAAPAEDFRRTIEECYRRVPAVRAALPQFSTFGLLEAIRQARDPAQTLLVGRFSATTTEAIGILRELSAEDVSSSHPWYSPNHPHFSTMAGALGGLFFGISMPTTGTALLVGLAGALCCYGIASVLRFQIRNSVRRVEYPQWICALHVDRYLQAHHRGAPLTGLRVEDLPNPGVRRKAPFYDLHNQILAGPDWTYHAALQRCPPLMFAPTSALPDET